MVVVIYKTLSDPASCGGSREESNELMLQMGKLRMGRSVVSSKCHSSQQQWKRQVSPYVQGSSVSD